MFQFQGYICLFHVISTGHTSDQYDIFAESRGVLFELTVTEIGKFCYKATTGYC